MIRHWTSLAAALLALPATAAAQSDDAEDLRERAELVAVAADGGADLKERERAIVRATAMALVSGPPPREGPLRDEVRSILEQLQRHRTDAEHETLITLALRALRPFRPLSGLTEVLRPYLRPDTLRLPRRAALKVVYHHAVPGLGEELERFIDETEEERPRDRQQVQRLVLEAARAIPPEQGRPLLLALLDRSSERGIRVGAATTLGDRPHRREAVGARLLEAAGGGDEVLATRAALALERHGRMDGIGRLVDRFRERQSVRLYRAICRAAHRSAEGFAGVPPGDLYRRDDARGDVKAAVFAWWDAARDRSPAEELFRGLARHGIERPERLTSKAAVSALIDGLTVDPRWLRYAALDRLVDLTGRADLAADFRKVITSEGGNAALRETEPQRGFRDERRRRLLRRHQRERADQFRDWWARVRGRATFVDGQWRVE